MHQATPMNGHANDCIARTLSFAVEGADKPRHQIARDVGMHRETLLRVVRGERPIGLDEAARILSACGAFPRATIVLALAGQEDLACEWMRSEMGEFLEEFFGACQLSSSERSAGGSRMSGRAGPMARRSSLHACSPSISMTLPTATSRCRYPGNQPTSEGIEFVAGNTNDRRTPEQ